MDEPNAKRKIVCVLYDDPVDGYPPKYARDGIPTLARTHTVRETPILALAVLTAA